MLCVREWHVWGACSDMHGYPLRSDAHSLIALQCKTADG
jgi:hypothetical protein